MKKPKDIRLHPVFGAIVFMAAADGYVMVRRPGRAGRVPRIVPKDVWDTLAAAPSHDKGQ